MDATSAFKAASRGDGEAQRFMAERAVEAVNTGDVPRRYGLIEALFWSRQAASNGAVPVRYVVALLLGLADEARTEGCERSLAIFEGEALTLLNLCADSGDEEAAGLVVQISDKATEAGMKQALFCTASLNGD